MSVSRSGNAVVGKTNVSGDFARVRSAEQRGKTTVEVEGEISSLNKKGRAGGRLRDSLHDKVPLVPRANGHNALIDVRSRLSRRRRRRVGERLVAPRGRLDVGSLDGVDGLDAELYSVLESWCRRWRRVSKTWVAAKDVVGNAQRKSQEDLKPVAAMIAPPLASMSVPSLKSKL